MKANTLQNNFTGGEITPLLHARSDIAKYNSSCEELVNVIPQIYGGIKKRGGLRIVHTGLNSATMADGTQVPLERYLVPFYFDQGNSYIIDIFKRKDGSFGGFVHATNRVYQDSSGNQQGFIFDGSVYANNLYAFRISGPTWKVSSSSIRYSKLQDSILFSSDNIVPTFVKRNSNRDWSSNALLFSYPALGEYYYRPNLMGLSSITLTIGAYSPSGPFPQGITLTASASFFVNSDVGREITADDDTGGRMVISSFSSSTSVICTIFEPFSATTLPAAKIRFSTNQDNAAITVPIHNTVGQSISIVATNFQFRTTEFPAAASVQFPNIPVYFSVNNGIFKITAVSYTAPTTTFTATVIKIADANTVAVTVNPGAWEFLSNIYTNYTINATTGVLPDRPDSLSFYQQRLWLSGSSIKKSKVVASGIGAYGDFELGAKDTDALDFDIADTSERVTHLIPFGGDLLAFTGSGVYSIKGGVETAVTATNINISKISDIGSGNAIPQIVFNEIYYVDVTGTRLLSAIYDANLQSYNVNHESKLAEHITRAGIKQLAYQATPNSTLWVLMNDGNLASLTVDKTEGIVGWARHEFGKEPFYEGQSASEGKIDSIACVYHSVKKVDVLYVTYIHQLGADLLKILCLMDDDCQLDFSYKATSPTPKNLWTLPRYMFAKYSVVSDGVYIGEYKLAPGIDATQSYATLQLVDNSSSIEVGCKFSVKAKLLPVAGAGQDGSFDHKNIKIGEVAVKCYQTLGAKFNGEYIGSEQVNYDVLTTNLYNFNNPLAPSPLPPTLGPFTLLQPFSGTWKTNKLGWFTRDDTNPRDADEVESITITQDLPYPFHILSVMRRVTVN